MSLPNTPPPRLPKVIWEELGKKLKRMNNGVKFPNYKTGEACAFDIARLQKEFEISKKCYIIEVPELVGSKPVKSDLVDLFVVK